MTYIQKELFERYHVKHLDATNLQALINIMPEESPHDFDRVLQEAQRRGFFYFRKKIIPIDHEVYAGDRGSIRVTNIFTPPEDYIRTSTFPTWDEISEALSFKLDTSTFLTFEEMINRQLQSKASKQELTTKLNISDFEVFQTGNLEALRAKMDVSTFDQFKSTLHGVAFTGAYSDLTGTPTPLELAAVATTGSYGDLLNKPSFATVATSGSYNDLTNKPTIPAAPDLSGYLKTSGGTLTGHLRGTTINADAMRVTDKFYQKNIIVKNSYMGNLPTGDANSGDYWRNMSGGEWYSGAATWVTNNKGAWSVVLVYHQNGDEGLGRHTRIFWLGQGGEFVYGSVSETQTQVNWTHYNKMFNGVLPDGDLNSPNYLKGLKSGYYYSNDNPKVTGKPVGYAMVEVMNTSTTGSGGDGAIIFHAYVTGNSYRRGWNTNYVSSWAMALDTRNTADRIIEYGSNSNGHYWKYESGRLVCRGDGTCNGVNTAWGGMAYGYLTTRNWVFPHPFKSNYVVISGSSNSYAGWVVADAINATQGTGMALYRGTQTSAVTAVTMIADGFWK